MNPSLPTAGRLRPRCARALLAAACLTLAAGCGTLNSRSMNSEGVRLFQEGQHQQAMLQFQQAIYADPNNADAYYNIAATVHRMASSTNQPAQYQQAESYYNQCLGKDPNHVNCYRGLAVMLIEQDRTEEAFRLLEGWADRQTGMAEPKIELARLYEEFGDRGTAENYLLSAIEVSPNNPRALAAIGKIREQQGNYVAALENYQRSLWYDRFQPEVATRVAQLQASLGPAAPAPMANPDSRTVTRAPGVQR